MISIGASTSQSKKKTAANDFNRRFNELKAKFRNQVQTVMEVMADVAMLAVTMMFNVVLRVKERQCDHHPVKYV